MEEAFLKLNKFFSNYKSLSFKKGQTILRPGEDPPGVFFIKKGFARLYSVSNEGEELTFVIFKSEDFFPLMWAISQNSNNYYLEAMTNCEVAYCPRKDFRSFLKENITVAYELTSIMLVRFEGLLQKMEHLVFGNASDKVARALFVAGERLGIVQNKSIILPLPLTHKDIASLTGLTRETVSIEMKRFERDGIISYKGKYIRIEDIKKLRRETLIKQD